MKLVFLGFFFKIENDTNSSVAFDKEMFWLHSLATVIGNAFSRAMNQGCSVALVQIVTSGGDNPVGWDFKIRRQPLCRVARPSPKPVSIMILN